MFFLIREDFVSWGEKLKRKSFNLNHGEYFQFGRWVSFLLYNENKDKQVRQR